MFCQVLPVSCSFLRHLSRIHYGKSYALYQSLWLQELTLFSIYLHFYNHRLSLESAFEKWKIISSTVSNLGGCWFFEPWPSASLDLEEVLRATVKATCPGLLCVYSNPVNVLRHIGGAAPPVTHLCHQLLWRTPAPLCPTLHDDRPSVPKKRPSPKCWCAALDCTLQSQYLAPRLQVLAWL